MVLLHDYWDQNKNKLSYFMRYANVDSEQIQCYLVLLPVYYSVFKDLTEASFPPILTSKE